MPTGHCLGGYPGNVPSATLQAGLDWTRTFSPNLVNEARLNYYRLVLQFGGNSIGNTVPTENDLATLWRASVVPPGYAGFGYSNVLPDGRVTNSYQLQDNLSWTHGRHTVKAGTNLTYQRSPNIWLPNYNGTYSFAHYGRLLRGHPQTRSASPRETPIWISASTTTSSTWATTSRPRRT